MYYVAGLKLFIFIILITLIDDHWWGYSGVSINYQWDSSQKRGHGLPVRNVPRRRSVHDDDTD